MMIYVENCEDVGFLKILNHQMIFVENCEDESS